MTGSRPALRHRRRVAWGVALALLACAAPPTHGTVVVGKDFAALCAEADWIFVGTVRAVASRWSDPARQGIETAVTFGELTRLRGDLPGEATLTFAGGEVEGLREDVAGVPQFRVGDRWVVFARDGRFVSPLVGFSQGAFRVVDGANGPAVFTVHGRPVVAVDRAALRLDAPASAPAVPLDDFLVRVRRELAAHGAGPR